MACLYAEPASNVIRELSLSELLEAPRRKQTDNVAEDVRLLPLQEFVPPVAIFENVHSKPILSGYSMWQLPFAGAVLHCHFCNCT